MFGAILPPFDAVGALDPVPVTGVTLVLENKGVQAPHNTTLFVAGDKLRSETGGAAVIFDGASKKITILNLEAKRCHQLTADEYKKQAAGDDPHRAAAWTRCSGWVAIRFKMRRRAVGCPTCVAGRPPG